MLLNGPFPESCTEAANNTINNYGEQFRAIFFNQAVIHEFVGLKPVFHMRVELLAIFSVHIVVRFKALPIFLVQALRYSEYIREVNVILLLVHNPASQVQGQSQRHNMRLLQVLAG